jgi:hypothetical protein
MRYATIAIISACTLSAFAYEPPPIDLSAAAFPPWRDSVHMLVVTNYTSAGVDLTLLIEKPAPEDVYWNLHLNLFDGTNKMAELAVGDELLGAEVLAETGAKLMGVKAVQKFTLSIRSNSLAESTLNFTQRKRSPRPWEFGNLTAPTNVHLRDVVNGATGGFRKGEPLFPGR